MNGIGFIHALSRVAGDFISRLQNPHAVPVVYFSGTPNVGDLVNEYLIPKLSGKKIVKVSSSMTPHMRGIGSVVGSASRFSHIWGSGSIDGKQPKRNIKSKHIYALRGKKTRDMLSLNIGTDLSHLPLGDPAILMKHHFNPKIMKSGHVGIVPHYSDESIIAEYLKSFGSAHARIISVRQQPEDFISDICRCDFILSSSLHGLILADTYSIPNKWFSASNHLLGGSFKFEDYYSTTESPREGCEYIGNAEDLRRVVDKSFTLCRVKSYVNCDKALTSSFPLCFTNQF